jgi:hypothetical protein
MLTVPRQLCDTVLSMAATNDFLFFRLLEKRRHAESGLCTIARAFCERGSLSFHYLTERAAPSSSYFPQK